MTDTYEDWTTVKASGEIMVSLGLDECPEGDDPGYLVYRHLIVAWRIPNDGGVPRPVIAGEGTIDPVYDPQGRVHGILVPSGTILEFDGCGEYASIKAFGESQMNFLRRTHNDYWENHRQKTAHLRPSASKET